MKVDYQIRSFERILSEYDGNLPLHRFLLNFFRANKQMGSSDRRWASRYLYSFFRFGNCLASLPALERLAIADFLCNEQLSLISKQYLGDLSAEACLKLDDKISLIVSKYPAFSLADVFSFTAPLSTKIDRNTFLKSFWQQPNLFIRVADANLKKIKNAIANLSIPVQEISATCLALPNGTQLERILGDQYHYEVQDYSSQQTATYYKPNQADCWWDCCAASGGKSLLLHSIEPSVKLLVSDVRETSLKNLQERFRRAKLTQYQLKVLDLTENNEQLLHDFIFDGILLDAPCSGSGTWGRTPEMLRYFDQEKIQQYQNLQRSIALNVLKYLKVGQPLIYMTCSVFAQENEDNVAYLLQNAPLKLVEMDLIEGYSQRADNMFVARFIKVEDA